MKRLAAILLGLALLCPAALGETFLVDCWSTEETPGYALLLKDDGTALTPPETYGAIAQLSNGDMSLFCATRFNEQIIKDVGEVDDDYRAYQNMALVDAEGHALTDYLYFDMARDPGGAIIGRRWPTGVDVLDDDGNVLFTGDYIDIRPTGEGGWLALRGEDQKQDGQEVNALVAVDADGTAHDTGLHTGYFRLEPFCDGLCPVSDIVELNGKAVILNAKGERAKKQTFEQLSEVNNGYVITVEDELYGLYKMSTGRYLLPPVYDYIHLDSAYSRAVFIASQGGDVEVYDAQTGEKLLSRSYPGANYVFCWMLSEDTLQVGEDYDRREICDLTGNAFFQVNTKNDVMTLYTNAYGIPQRFVESVGEWPNDKNHIIDLDGNQVGPDWQRIDTSLWKDGHGRYVVTRYELHKDRDGEMYPLYSSYRSGVCDENGELCLAMNYQNIQVLSLDRYCVETPERIGMVDGEGKWYYAIEKYAALMD